MHCDYIQSKLLYSGWPTSSKEAPLLPWLLLFSFVFFFFLDFLKAVPRSPGAHWCQTCIDKDDLELLIVLEFGMSCGGLLIWHSPSTPPQPVNGMASNLYPRNFSEIAKFKNSPANVWLSISIQISDSFPSQM